MRYLLLLLSLLSFDFIQAQTDSSAVHGKVVIKRQRKPSDAVKDSMYQDRVAQRKLDGVYIPKDLYDCFRELNKALDDDAKQTFMEFNDEEVDAKTHNTLGLWMKTRWQMYDGSRISDYFRRMGVPHPEYSIGIIIQTYHRHLHGRELGIKELVKKFQANWQEKQKATAEEMLQNAKQ